MKAHGFMTIFNMDEKRTNKAFTKTNTYRVAITKHIIISVKY